MKKLFATLIAVAFAAATVTPAFAADKMDKMDKKTEATADAKKAAKGKGDAKKTDGKTMAEEKKTEKAK